jgi:hypothetical protein
VTRDRIFARGTPIPHPGIAIPRVGRRSPTRGIAISTRWTPIPHPGIAIPRVGRRSPPGDRHFYALDADPPPRGSPFLRVGRRSGEARVHDGSSCEANGPSCVPSTRGKRLASPALPGRGLRAGAKAPTSGQGHARANLYSDGPPRHRHSRTSGMSSPCAKMYSLCSTSLSRSACLTCAARAPSDGTRSMTSSTR